MDGGGGGEKNGEKGGEKNVSKKGSMMIVFTHSEAGSAEGDATIDASDSGSSAATRPTEGEKREGLGDNEVRRGIHFLKGCQRITLSF